MLLQKGIEPSFVLARVLFLFIDDQGRISVNPVPQRFVNALERLNVDDPNQDLLTISVGQLLDPVGEKKVLLFQIFGIFIQIPFVFLFLQTYLVSDIFTVRS